MRGSEPETFSLLLAGLGVVGVMARGPWQSRLYHKKKPPAHVK
jgi:hypothetical protein